MKNRFLIIAFSAIAITISLVAWIVKSGSAKRISAAHDKTEQKGDEETEAENEEEETGADKSLSAWFWAKGYPDATNLTQKYQDGWQQFLDIKKNSLPGNFNNTRTTGYGNWSFLGPRVFGGRILCLAINPTVNAGGKRTIFAGSASGGIWKTYVSGTGASAWQAVETNTQVLGVASITYHPTDTSILLAGTGEVYRVENYVSGSYSSNQVNNIGRNAWKARGTYGVGILRSTDAGKNWTQVLTKIHSDLFGIQEIKFQPGSTTVVFACASDGLYKSTDAGITWSQIWTGNYCSDIVINPSNPLQIVIAAGNVTNNPKGVWRSVDGGANFFQITGSGFPNYNQFRGFTALTMLGSTPDTIIASVGAGDVNVDGTYNEVEIYRSGDFGSSWASVSNSHHSKYQSWFAHGVTPFPGNSKKVFIYGTFGAVLTMSGTPATTGLAATVGSNSGSSSSYLTDGQQEGSTNYLHSDIHDVKFIPGSTTTAYWATDGGVFLTTDQGATFSSCNGGLNVQQFYPTIAQSQNVATPNIIIGGLQDNNTVRCNNTAGWARIIGGDGGPSMFKPDDETKVLGSSDTRGVFRSTNTGSSFPTSVLSYLGNVPFGNDDRTSFCSPIGVSANNTNRWYVGSDNIHISTDAGVTFTGNGVPGTAYIEAFHKPAIAIGVSPLDANKLFVSVSPFSQNISTDALFYSPPANIRKSINGGTSFTTVTGTLPDRMVTDFAISNTNDNDIFITLGGFGSASHVYFSSNGGTTWSPRGSGLPDVPFNTILIDPNDPQIIYAGCDYGVYVSPDRGVNWYDFNNGFWDATLVVDLQVAPGNKLRAATHGKGIFETALFTIAALPVHFTSFTGVNKGVYNELNWNTAQESNLSHYELEQSIDGNLFQKIADVPGRNSTAPESYTKDDNITGNPANAFYYRVKSVDKNGSYTYSDIVLINVNHSNEVKILGNPFTSIITIQYTAQLKQTVQAQLLDMQGKLLRKKEFNINSGNGNLQINDLDNLPSGIYVLDIWFDKKRLTQKVVKR